ncbi:(2Fe-2S)-binding protein [Natrarchaeobius halalkaliphilus]|uniref:(2Fe-2S)-binding protein n=1 Tax=Natrarchaeobius halalkaliphilus TaxID=1679091 RepID=A0A3N6LTB2_9EURY|nr:(2Fe-2S)-binding protein [Natrarchaeobius halalkaliphilus]RQG93298.1 (2Fe-2S)-binding protein [Natrarchaeobius halalkaliphilus]
MSEHEYNAASPGASRSLTDGVSVQETENQEGIDFSINGNAVSFSGDPEKPLLYVLRNDAGLNGPKFGCGVAQCGSCEVLVDGETVISCTTPVEDVAESEVTTTRGLGTSDDPHPVQEAFIEAQAAQCGYCIHGMIVEAAALLEENPDPSDEEIDDALADNLCRCGTHDEIRTAVNRAAEEMN